MAITTYAVAAMPAAPAARGERHACRAAGRVLTVAIEYPMDFELLDKFVCNLRIEPVVASGTPQSGAVARHYGEASDA